VSLGENLVKTGLDFALFLLFHGSGMALFGCLGITVSCYCIVLRSETLRQYVFIGDNMMLMGVFLIFWLLYCLTSIMQISWTEKRSMESREMKLANQTRLNTPQIPCPCILACMVVCQYIAVS